MKTTNFKKSADLLVMPRFGGKGYTVKHVKNGNVVQLKGEPANLFVLWPEDTPLALFGSQIDELITGGFVLSTASSPTPEHLNLSIDELRPIVGSVNVKYYQETPNLTIVFNTKTMHENNPLLALGPYGSLVWSGVANNRTISQIRHDALRVFGRDEVVPFLYRLRSMNIIELNAELPVPEVNDELMAKDFPAPYGARCRSKPAVAPTYFVAVQRRRYLRPPRGLHDC